MEIKENISLRAYHTFGIEASARYFASFGDQEELEQLLEFAAGRKGLSMVGAAMAGGKGAPMPMLVLGGGSNVLFTRDFDGIVMINAIMGIELIREDEHYVYVKVGAGENWHGFVQSCLRRNWAGVENLALIPGSVGASPMQNIGAYGVEIKEVFYELEAWDLRENRVFAFSVNDCRFGYRDSIFKRALKDRCVILNVSYRLNSDPEVPYRIWRDPRGAG